MAGIFFESCGNSELQSSRDSEIQCPEFQYFRITEVPKYSRLPRKHLKFDLIAKSRSRSGHTPLDERKKINKLFLTILLLAISVFTNPNLTVYSFTIFDSRMSLYAQGNRFFI
jgi:hypothetical protein